MTKEMKRPTSHISGNSIKPALSKAVEFYTDNNRQAYECIHERDEYIDYLEYDSKQKDERILKLENENSFMRDERTTFDSNGMAVEPKLQQQAMPVVPEFVAEWIERLKTNDLKPLKNPETYGETGFTEEKLQNILFWISENQEDYMRAWLDGYTVEKQQLFYLKNKLTTSYLILDTSTGYFEHWGSTEATGRYKSSFTQQEIDSMQTGSYEKIEVEEEE